MSNATLLQLSQTLLQHCCALPPEHQAAWRIATQHLCSRQLSAAALHLTLALGHCCVLDEALQQQLMNLVHTQPLIDALLLTGLGATLDAQQHDATATTVRAVRRLALFAATHTHSSALTGIWDSPQHRQRLLQAACSSPAAAEAVAALAATAAASSALPAANLLHDLLCPLPPPPCQGSSSSNSSSSSSRKAWIAVGLRPLLLQIHARLQPTTARADCTSTPQRCAPSYQGVPQDAAAGFQQLWLLLCAAVAVSDGQLLHSETLDTLSSFFRDPAVNQALHTALLGPASKHEPAAVAAATEAVQQGTLASAAPTQEAGSLTAGAASVAAGAPSTTTSSGHGDSDTSSSSSSSCSRQCVELRVPTLQLIGSIADHSASLAQQCFDSLAPVLPELLAASGPCLAAPAAALPPTAAALTDTDRQGEASSSSAAAQGAKARAVALQVWQQLLLKGRGSYPGSLHALLQTWLFPAADALAAAAGTGGCQDALPHTPEGSHQAEQQQLLHSCPLRSRAAAIAAAFVPLAWELQAASKPLLCAGGPGVMLQQLTPHPAALVELIQAGTRSVGSPQQAATGAASDDWSVLILAMWLLQSWVAALQHPKQQCQLLGSHLAAHAAQQSAASILPALMPRMVAAVAALLVAVASTGPASDSLRVRCVIKGLDLGRALRACQPVLGPHSVPTDGGSSSSRNNPGSTRVAGGTGAVTAAASGGCGPAAGDEPTEPCWQQLLVALGGLFARSPTDPMSLAYRQLLQTACYTLGDLAGKLPNAAAAAGRQGPLQEQQQQCVVWQGLQSDLQVLHEDLVTRKLVRSTSRKELLQAVGEALDLLSKAG